MKLDPVRFAAKDDEFPQRLRVLGPEATAGIWVAGPPALLREPIEGFFSSVRAPCRAVLPVLELAGLAARRGVGFVGGFQSPIERAVLEVLLDGDGPIVVAPARSIPGMTLPPELLDPFLDCRVAVVGLIRPRHARVSDATARERNRLVAALATSIFVAHATPAGRLESVIAEAIDWGRPVSCLDLRENRDLVVLGASPIAPPKGSHLA